jgi:DNA repair exonuclease SbcCD ATPase subunit
MNDDPVKIYCAKSEYEKILHIQYTLMLKEAERYRELSEQLHQRLAVAEELLRRVPHSLSAEMERLDKEIDDFLYLFKNKDHTNEIEILESRLTVQAELIREATKVVQEIVKARERVCLLGVMAFLPAHRKATALLPKLEAVIKEKPCQK